MRRSAVSWILALGSSLSAAAQDAAPDIRAVRPLGAGPGQVVSLEVAGEGLDGPSTLRFEAPGVRVDDLKAEAAKLTAKVTLPADVAPGPLRFRVVNGRGISNPGRLFLGPSIPTVAEVEPNDGFRRAQLVASPTAIEGKLGQGNEVDVFAVDMKAGETLAAEVLADRAGSGLDPLLTVFSADGRTLAADDDLLGKDAACWVKIKISGRYYIQMQDADGQSPDPKKEAGRTREYRLLLGAVPVVASAFPAGARVGEAATIRLLGANLPDAVEARSDRLGDNPLRISTPHGPPHPPTIRVGEGAEVAESGANDEADEAQVVDLPAAVNGRLEVGGDIDYYRIKARRGEEGDYAISALSARVGSPADPLLAAVDARGASLAEDDDKLGRDARLERPIDSTQGTLIAVRDAYGRGGPRFVYRLEFERLPRRSVRVVADLGRRSIPRGGSLTLDLGLERRGFDGPVSVLAGPLPRGVRSMPVTIAGGLRSGVLVLSADLDADLGAIPLRLTTRDAPAASAFGFRERWGGPRGPMEALADEPLIAVAGPSSMVVAIAAEEVAVAPGGKVEVKVTIERRGEAIGKRATVWLRPGGAEPEGFAASKAVDVPADATSATLTLEAKADARPRRSVLSARARREGSGEGAGVDAAGVPLVVSGP